MIRVPSLPKLVVAGVAALGIGFALFLGGASVPPGQGVPVASRELRFEDRQDGAIAVYEADAVQPMTMLAPGTSHFIRTTMRSLVRERRFKDVADPTAIPFRLTLWPDGRLILEDPATARMLDLRAYGETNALAFAELLPAREGRR